MVRVSMKLASAALALASAVSLPSVDVGGFSNVQADAKWWTRVDDKVFYAPPPASLMELSQDSKDYYYAIGSETALTDEMKRHRVGGAGRWHLFHLPGGPSMLQVPTQGSRRGTFSSLVQLQHGEVIKSHTFPEYKTNESYVYPGTNEALELEKAAVAPIDATLFKEYLTKVTQVGADKDITRSNTNPTASHHMVEFLQTEFKALGLSSCLQQFSSADGDRDNIVVYIPGKSRQTLTVGAHYDSRPFTGAAPGANDNGSGVALLLALAKAFTEAKLKPEKDMYLVGFAAEEEGLWGSKAFVDGLVGEGSAPIPEACRPQESSFLQARSTVVDGAQHSAIIIDEIGWKSGNIKASANLESKDTALSFDLLNQLAQSNAAHNAGKLLSTHSPHPFGSDHMSWIDRSLPAVLIINGDDEAYPAYHSSTDTIDNVDMEYSSEITRMVFGGVVRAAGLQA